MWSGRMVILDMGVSLVVEYGMSGVGSAEGGGHKGRWISVKYFFVLLVCLLVEERRENCMSR